MQVDETDRPERSDHNPDGIKERVLKEVSVAEFGPVLFPAYEGATAQARSLTDEYAFRRFMDLPQEKLDALADYWRARDTATVEDESADDEDAIDDAIRTLADSGLDASAITDLLAAERSDESAPGEVSGRAQETPTKPTTVTSRRTYLSTEEEGPKWRLP